MPLHATGHRLADERERLVAVEAAQLDDLAVQLEAVVGELRLAKARPASVLVDQPRPVEQAHADLVEVRLRQVPQPDGSELVQVDGVRDRLARSGRGRHASGGPGEGLPAFPELDLERQRAASWLQALEEAVDVEAGTRGQHVLRLREDVLDEGAGNDAQGDLAVDAAEREVVDLVTEGRDVGSLRGVDVDGQDVLAVEVDVGRQIEREGRVAAPVLAEPLAVDPHGGRRHHPLEVDEHVTATRLGRKPETPPVGRDELGGLLAEAVPGQADVGVGDDDALEAGVVELPGVAFRIDRPAEAPVPVHRKDEPASGGRRARPALAGRQGFRREDGSGQECARPLEKTASIHG